ncbi:MAG TPA: hypothetical protein VNO50_11015 [Pyrinomonadaceae bacterium]|nr:hypothetical protein [Pyrinomonadaceae bacterium]
MDIAISVFKLSNRRGFFVPGVNIQYGERDSNIVWNLVCGGTRAYIVRFGSPLLDDPEEQSAGSHFMVRRVTSSLVMGGAGLFQSEACGRLFLRNINGDVSWDGYLDWPDLKAEEASRTSSDAVQDWCRALCSHTVLRRAADDAHAALSNPHEALMYVYRGLEWLVEGLGIDWKELATDLGASVTELRELKKAANVDTGVRHATKSGIKMRADTRNYYSWICALFDGINRARARLEPGFKPADPKRVAAAVGQALPMVPYD